MLGSTAIAAYPRHGATPKPLPPSPRMHTLWLRFALYSEWNARLRLRAAHTIMRLRRAQPRGARRDENHTGSGSAMSKPLEGIKVIEVGQEIQGPFAGLLLAYM